MGILDAPGYTRTQANTAFVPQTAKRRGLLPPDPGTTRLLSFPTVMASPPTVTIGTANAGTAITGATRRTAADPALTYLGAGYVEPPSANLGGYANGRTSSYLTSSAPSTGRLRVEFETDADQFEAAFITTASGTAAKFRFTVDGQLATALPQTGLTSGGASYFVRVSFGTRANRRIIIEGQYVQFLGVWAHPSVTLWKTIRPIGPRVVWVGDSFSEGSGGNWWWDSWAVRAGQLLGWNVYPSAVGSTGYLSTGGGGGKVKYRDRIAADVTPLAPEIAVVAGGFNDAGVFTATQLGTEAGLLFDTIKSGTPSATLILCGPNWPIGVTANGTQTQMRDALQTAAVGKADYFVDPIAYPSGTSWLTGTGRVGATTGNGNADYYTSTDGTHPTQEGHDYLARRFASAIAAQL